MFKTEKDPSFETILKKIFSAISTQNLTFQVDPNASSKLIITGIHPYPKRSKKVDL